MTTDLQTLDELTPPFPARAEPEPPGEDVADPDPFSIGLAIFGAIAGGGSFLEARRQRRAVERQHRQAFRSAWFSAQRTLISFRRVVDEFETYVAEDGYGEAAFRIGVVRLTVDAGRRSALKRLHALALSTAALMADSLDDLSDFLDGDDQPSVDAVLQALSQVNFPERYRDVVRMSRDALDLYTRLLEGVAQREGLSSTAA